MAPVSRLLVLLAILLLPPSRLLGQAHETANQQTGPQPAHTAAVPSSLDDFCCPARSCRAVSYCCCPDDAPVCGECCESIFVFGGLLTRGSMGDTADVFNVTYDGNYLIALGYQRLPWSSRHFHLGWEVGAAGRFGDASSAEIWGGLAIRHHGVTLGRHLTITPSITAGFSTVTATMGHERHREVTKRGDATFLFYLGPEVAISSPAYPNVEFFYRLHHRCGARRTLGGLSEGYNGNVAGLRFRF